MASGDKVFVKGVQGKTVDRIVLSDDNEEMAIEVRFADDTSFNVRLAPAPIQIMGVDILGWKKGNSRVLKRFL